MSIILDNVLQTLVILALISSLPGNTFILVVILKEWFKSRRLCVTHQLFGGISFWNIVYSVLQIIVYAYYKGPIKGVRSDIVNEFSLFLTFFATSCNLWSSTWLCVHFCLKTVDINRRVYIYLQTRFQKLVPWILFSSVLWSVLIGIPLKWYMASGSSQDWRHGYSNHTMSLNNTLKDRPSYYTTLPIIGIHVPFILFFSSASTNIIYLCRHMKRVRDNAEGFSLSSVEAHVRAARTITRLLILNILYLIGVVFYAVTTPNLNYLYFSYILLPSCNILTSFTLIKGNRILNKALVDSILFFCRD